MPDYYLGLLIIIVLATLMTVFHDDVSSLQMLPRSC